MDNTEKRARSAEKTGVPSRDGEVGIRAVLNNMGFSNESIGYDDKNGTVTLNGKSLIKPSYVDEKMGISYAPMQQVQKSVTDFFSDTKNPVVKVSDAYAATAGKYGLDASALSFGNGTVSIGGKPLNTLYIDDSGKAWAWKNDVEKLTDAYADSVGVRTSNDAAERVNNEYLSDIRDALDSIKRRDEFSYDPDSDPVYAAYKQKYLLEGDRASRNAMADYSALTGGYVNSAAATAGALANNYYVQQLNDVIPELAEQAYNRYNDSYQRDLDYVAEMVDIYNSVYDNELKVNKQTLENANAAAASSVQRDSDAYQKQLAEEERLWDNMKREQDYYTQDRENYWSERFNKQKLKENDLKSMGYELDNRQQQIYLEYYRRLLDNELAGDALDNQKTQAEIYKIYSGIK